ncbi:MAG: hypothetical protein AAF298_29550 [Cyanobacteria bacterium P01_A01_bin.40]
MLEAIKQRRLSYPEIFRSSFAVYKQNFNFILALDLLVFITWNLIPESMLESDFGIIVSLFYSCFVYSAIFIAFSYLVKSNIEENTINYNQIWDLCWLKIPKVINVQLCLFPYVFLMIPVSLILVFMLSIFLKLLKIDSFLFGVHGVGFAVVFFCISMLIMVYLYQYSIYAAIINHKNSYNSLKYSSKLVLNNPWQSLFILCISLMGLFGTDYVSSLMINALLKLGVYYLLLWIFSFKFQMLSSFFLLANIIGYLNIDYAYRRDQ